MRLGVAQLALTFYDAPDHWTIIIKELAGD